jgi:hypothetical protein
LTKILAKRWEAQLFPGVWLETVEMSENLLQPQNQTKRQNMKSSMRIASAVLAAGLGFLAATGLQAALVDTSKGSRLALPSQGTRLTTEQDFRSLREGDKVVVHCPMMKTTHVTYIRNVDSKGHAKVTETKQGWKVSGCNIIVQRKGGSKETSTMMVCPDGTLTPVHCRKG